MKRHFYSLKHGSRSLVSKRIYLPVISIQDGSLASQVSEHCFLCLRQSHNVVEQPYPIVHGTGGRAVMQAISVARREVVVPRVHVRPQISRRC